MSGMFITIHTMIIMDKIYLFESFLHYINYNIMLIKIYLSCGWTDGNKCFRISKVEVFYTEPPNRSPKDIEIIKSFEISDI